MGRFTALLFCFFICSIRPASSQHFSFLPKNKQLWNGYTIAILPPLFQEHPMSNIQSDSISSLPSFTKTINPRELYTRVKVTFPDGLRYVIFEHDRLDTLFIQYSSILLNIEQLQKEKEIQKEISKITYKQLKKYRYGIFKKKMDKNKLKEAILSGEIYKNDSILYRSNPTLSSLSKAQFDSFYFEKLPFDFGWNNFDLFPLYLLGANSKQILFSRKLWESNSKPIAYSIFANSLFEERKSKLRELFSLIHDHDGDSFEGALALWYTYYFLKSGGLTFADSNSNAVTIDEIREIINTIEDGFHKKNFYIFLESLTPGDLLKQDYVFHTINGEQIKLSGFIDKEWVLLDFWATWCQPCIKAFPELAAFYSEYRNNFNLISISVDNDYGDFSRWVKRHEQKYQWPFLHATQSHPIVSNMKVRAYPSYFLIKVKTGETLGPIHTVSELRQVFENEQKTINH